MIPVALLGGRSRGYDIPYAKVFDNVTNSYLTRTTGVNGDRKEWTLSGWIKNNSFRSPEGLMVCAFGVNDFSYVAFVNQSVRVFTINSGVTTTNVQTTQVLRDVGEHFHLNVQYDTTQATAADRVIIEINGVPVTSYSLTTYPSLNYAGGYLNSQYQHTIGYHPATGYMSNWLMRKTLSEFYFIGNNAYASSEFGELDGSGRWIPKEFNGVFATNSVYLPFSNSSFYGEDFSGNNFDFTDVLTTTAMQVTDTPTNNHCTLNSIFPSAANISDGALASGSTPVRGTFNALAINSYWEVTAGGSNVTAGVESESGTTNTTTVTANKTFGFRLSTSGTLEYKNLTDAGSWTSITTGLTGVQVPYATGAAATWDFGQRGFDYTPPSGYSAINSANLDALAGPFDTFSSCGTEDDYSEGNYTGNGSADGPFVYLGYKPTYVCIDGTSYTDGSSIIDILSNGFKVRSTSAAVNTNTVSYAWEAWVDLDFKYGRAVANG